MELFKITKAAQTSNQEAEVSGDGMTGVAVQFFAPFGMAYFPKAGQLSYSFSVSGDEGNAAHMVPQTQIDLELQPGESAFGNFAAGCYMVFKNDGTINIVGDIAHVGKIESTGTHKATDFVPTIGPSHNNHKHTGVVPGVGTSGGIV